MLSSVDQRLTSEERAQAQTTFTTLQSLLEQPEHLELFSPKPPTRAYVDGAFDLIHSGHYNAIRQASLLCDELVVGVNSSEEI